MKPTPSSIANLASIAFLLALSTADRHWSIPVSLIGAGITYIGVALKMKASESNQAIQQLLAINQQHELYQQARERRNRQETAA